MKFITRIPAWIRNKYFIAFAAFCVVVVFLDKNDLFALERYAREKYLMKRDNEELFLVREKSENSKN